MGYYDDQGFWHTKNESGYDSDGYYHSANKSDDE